MLKHCLKNAQQHQEDGERSEMEKGNVRNSSLEYEIRLYFFYIFIIGKRL